MNFDFPFLPGKNFREKGQKSREFLPAKLNLPPLKLQFLITNISCFQGFFEQECGVGNNDGDNIDVEDGMSPNEQNVLNEETSDAGESTMSTLTTSIDTNAIENAANSLVAMKPPKMENISSEI